MHIDSIQRLTYTTTIQIEFNKITHLSVLHQVFRLPVLYKDVQIKSEKVVKDVYGLNSKTDLYQ